MARVRLQMPENYRFTTQINVRVTDLNYGNHLGNSALLGLLHEARLRYLASMSLTELAIGNGLGIIMADSALIYRGEAFLGDVLRVDLTPGDFSRAGFNLYYRVRRETDGQAIADAKTGLVCFDYRARQVAPLPATTRQLLEA